MNREIQKLVPTYLKQTVLILYNLFSAQHDKQEQEAFYRIVKLPDDADKRVYFQVIGKDITLKMLPEKIMHDDLLLLFNKHDMILITHLGTKNEVTLNPAKRELFKILKQIYNKGKSYFLVEKSTGEVSEYQAQDMFIDKTLANNFNGLDGMKIGYTVAEEHYKKIASLKGNEKI